MNPSYTFDASVSFVLKKDLVDGDLKLFESMAINLHLAQRYGGDLWPSNPDDQSRTVQWSVWGMTELEPSLMTLVLQRFMVPEGERDPAKVEEAGQALQRPLAVLDAALQGRDYLLGDAFTIADLNVASVLSWVRFLKVDLSPHPNLQRWFEGCMARPALARAQAKG